MNKEELIKTAQEKASSYNLDELKRLGFIPLNNLFFPSIYYPPLTMYPSISEEKIFADYNYSKENPLSVYVHIPFCLSKCAYCHWVTNVNNHPEDLDYYLKIIEKEMDIWKERLGMKVISPASVLIGGGTPSLLSPVQMERFLKSFRSRFDLSRCSQFSCETDPKTISGKVGMEKLKIMQKYGINRISLGVQSLNDKILEKMKRPHTAEEAIRAVTQIRAAGFKSLSIDLIYGYPGSTPELWLETLEAALSLDIDACQLYRLRIVPHGDKAGAIINQFEEFSESFPNLKAIYIMKELGELIFSQNGFKEHFRRIFSKSPEHISYYLRDYCCRLYNVIGIGISSWSSFQDRLTLNTGENLEEYYSYINKGKLPINRGKIRTADDKRRMALILPLKNCGISKAEYKNLTGIAVNDVFGEKIKKLIKFGLLEEDAERLTLTKKGGFFADEVVMQFYDSKYLPFSKSEYADGELNPYKKEERC